VDPVRWRVGAQASLSHEDVCASADQLLGADINVATTASSCATSQAPAEDLALASQLVDLYLCYIEAHVTRLAVGGRSAGRIRSLARSSGRPIGFRGATVLPRVAPAETSRARLVIESDDVRLTLDAREALEDEWIVTRDDVVGAIGQ
jgi:hypothetical protein